MSKVSEELRDVKIVCDECGEENLLEVMFSCAKCLRRLCDTHAIEGGMSLCNMCKTL